MDSARLEVLKITVAMFRGSRDQVSVDLYQLSVDLVNVSADSDHVSVDWVQVCVVQVSLELVQVGACLPCLANQRRLVY